MKDERLVDKEKWLNLLYYFAEKYSTDINSSKVELQNHAKKLYGQEVDERIYTEQNMSDFQKNDFNLGHFRKYFKELIEILERVIINPRNKIDYMDELCSRLNVKIPELPKLLSEKDRLRILVTATMSAGKSTVVNALIGHPIMVTKNESCTAKRFTVTEDPILRDQILCDSENITVKINKNEASILKDFQGNDIYIRSEMHHIEDEYLWEVIDTPGVNSSTDPEHKVLTESMIKSNEFDILLYVMNGNNLGTNDDLQHLKFIKEHVESHKIIFVVNKVDQFRSSQDSILESCNKCELTLQEIGFEYPIVLPISAYAAYLIKRKQIVDDLNDEQEEELLFLINKFNRKQFDLTDFYEDSLKEQDEQVRRELEICGMAMLEKVITWKDGTNG